MLVTKISPAVKTAGRYNIFVDEKYSFSLAESQLLDLKLQKGQEIDEATLTQYQTESDFGKNYLRALDLISRRPRSEKELRDYAWRKQWLPENRDRVIARLLEHGYLDDQKFAQAFVRSRATGRNFSRRQMEQALLKKGIKKPIIEQTLAASEEFDELASLRALAAKKRPRYDSTEKLLQYLARQGFSYDDIKRVLTE